ncbi:MAG: PRC-barrel domain containing protein [Rhodanobacter sp.]|nr:MAG: PRC-barrel domain containing protein [Rhodanobacter sp.]TAL88996.1 MAG: PRC-barrel domain containing protein [Rhodanobacter sp.]TAM40408.1 MAG: PRC-barrel domain containing protein [Rhodanobacter sp.]TAN23233.1 MAG: PRC-barrel domain containing protein [Rhodanobacter sp.]
MTQAPHFLSASTLNGDTVKNHKDESLGDLKDIMTDTTTGKVAYAVLSCGGILGMGEKLFAVPWQALVVDGENKQLLLKMDKEYLKNAPGFDKDHWPDFADQQFTEPRAFGSYVSQPEPPPAYATVVMTARAAWRVSSRECCTTIGTSDSMTLA